MKDTGGRPTVSDDSLEVRAMALFSECLDIPIEQQQAWLAERCDGRPALLERVQRLLRADEDSTGFMESGPEFVLRANRVGERLGAYELVSELASGGMSTVYRARRVDGTYQHDVAIKLFRAFHMDPSVLRRFDTERQILAALEHPNIARIIDGGKAADGTPYVIMELVDGEPITRYCDRHRVDLIGRLNLFVKVCQALAFAHRRGIVHRDIKPGNVLVSESGEPKLIDFGIAKVLQPERMALELPETRLEQRPLTPEYASPEQLTGKPVGVASDIYSLGILLYELLTGQRPYQVAALSPAEAERVVCGTIPADPSQAIARGRMPPPAGLSEADRLRRQLRGDLDRIIMTAMRREPNERFESVVALAEDIDRHLAGQPVRARGASRWYRTSKFIGRHRLGVSATALAFVILAGALVAVQIQANEAQKQRDQAQLEARRAESAKQFLVEMIRRADPYENAESATLVGAIKQSIPDIEARFASQPQLEAEMRYAVGYALQNLGEIPLAREQVERSLEIRRRQGNKLDLAESEDAMGIVNWWESDFDQAAVHFRRALEAIEDEHDSTARLRRVTTLTNWAGMLIDSGDFGESQRLAERALAQADASDVDPSTLATLWANLATARDGIGDQEGAVDAFEQALAVQRESTGIWHPNYAIALNNFALLQVNRNELGEAVRLLEQSVEIRLRTLGESHPQTATALVNLARVQSMAGELEGAEASALRGLEVAIAGYGEGHPRIGKAHEALAIVYQMTGRHDLAREHAESALATYRSAPGIDPGWVTKIEELIASLESP